MWSKFEFAAKFLRCHSHSVRSWSFQVRPEKTRFYDELNIFWSHIIKDGQRTGRESPVFFFVPVPVPRDTKTSGERDLRHIESRDNGTVPGLTEIIVPKWRNFLSRGILGPGLSCRFLFRSQLSRGFKSRSRSLSRGFRIMRHSLCQ